MCQCPERGDPHFYSITETTVEEEIESVNALKGATLISTESSVAEEVPETESVNALKGATRISTLASGNPHK